MHHHDKIENNLGLIRYGIGRSKRKYLTDCMLFDLAKRALMLLWTVRYFIENSLINTWVKEPLA